MLFISNKKNRILWQKYLQFQILEDHETCYISKTMDITSDGYIDYHQNHLRIYPSIGLYFPDVVITVDGLFLYDDE
jgi:hypothetical protein